MRRVGAGGELIFEDGFLLSPRWPVMGGMALVCGGGCDICHIAMGGKVGGWWFETDLAIATLALVRDGEKVGCVPKQGLLPQRIRRY